MKRIVSAIVVAGLMAGCGGEPTDEPTPTDGEESYELVMPGKADNYYSNVAKEYELTGTVEVEMTDEQFRDDFEREKVVARRISAVGVYLTTYLTDKFRGIDINDDGEVSDDEVFFHNEEYGGFHAMVRNQSTEILEVEGEEGTYTAEFTIDVAGPGDLYDLLEADGAMRSDDGVSFDLRMPVGATSDPENTSGRPIRSFDPDAYDGELETVRLTARQLPDVANAYPYFREMFRDGVYDITLFYGHDYNASRNDLHEAEQAYHYLVEQGFEAPADSFEELGSDSGAFVRDFHAVAESDEYCVKEEVLRLVNFSDVVTLDSFLRADAARNIVEARAGEDGVLGTNDDVYFQNYEQIDDVYRVGPAALRDLKEKAHGPCESNDYRRVRIEIRVFHSDMFEGQRDYQHHLALAELTKRDVFFYNGHAGPYYGLYLDAGYEAYVSPDDLGMAELDEERQQIFVAQGCQTYSQYADMLYANPNKSEDNLDVITTVNYSYSRGTLDLLGKLIDSTNDVHVPSTYDDLVTTINGDYWNERKQVFYGVMGIDGNAQLHPYVNESSLGNECASHDECGVNTEANLCLGFTDGKSRCVVRTAAEAGCPDGSNYAYVASETYVLGGVCWKM